MVVTGKGARYYCWLFKPHECWSYQKFGAESRALSRPDTTKAEDWYDEVWAEATPFDLAALYDDLFAEYPPWIVYMRVLWELYGDEVFNQEQEDGTLSLTNFQHHGVWRALKILDELNGVIIADGLDSEKPFWLAG